MDHDGSQTVRNALGWYSLALVLSSVLACGVVFVRGYLLHQPYPWNTLLYRPDLRFWDLTVYYPRFAHFGDGLKFFEVPGHPFTYPAPCLYCYLFLIRLFPDPVVAYVVLTLSAQITAAVLLWRAGPVAAPENKHFLIALGLTLITSYPFLFLFDRANVESFVFIVLLGGMVAFVRRHYMWAAALFAVAASMKLYPGLFLLLLVRKKRYKDLVLAAVVGGATTLAALAGTGAGIQATAAQIMAGLNALRPMVVLQYRPLLIGFDHSFFTVLKQLIVFVTRSEERVPEVLSYLTTPYTVAVVLGFAALYVLRLSKMPLLNTLLAATVAMISLPYLSFDYTLVELYFPWGIFVIFLIRDVLPGRVRFSTSQALAVLLPFAVLFTPQTYLLAGNIGFGGQVKACALLVLLVVASKIQMPASILGEYEMTSSISIPYRAVVVPAIDERARIWNIWLQIRSCAKFRS